MQRNKVGYAISGAVLIIGAFLIGYILNPERLLSSNLNVLVINPPSYSITYIIYCEKKDSKFMSSTISKPVVNFSRSDLRPYQNDAVDFVKSTNGNCALWIYMGLGKTIITLTTLVDYFNQFEIGKVLVISRKRPCELVWPVEPYAWEHTQHLSTTWLTGTADDRKRLALKDGDIHIINQENFPKLVKYFGLRHWPYDTVIIDDAKGFKTQSAKNFKYLKAIRSKVDKIIQLTGTPAPNGYLQIWPQIFLLDGGKRLGKSITAYRNKYFIRSYNGYDWDLRPGAEKEIQDKISDIVLSLQAKGNIELGPEPIYNKIMIPLPQKLRDKYRELEREFLLQIDDKNIIAPTQAALSNKLLQFCNGILYDDQKDWVKVHDLKLDALEESVDELNGEPLLVAYNFKPDLIRILKRFKKKAVTLDTPNFQQKWDNGDITIAVAHPDSAGHALSLQHGGYTGMWYGINWNLELYLQFNERFGQTRQAQSGYDRAPHYHHLLIENSIDETVYNRLGEKNFSQQDLLKALIRDAKTRVF